MLNLHYSRDFACDYRYNFVISTLSFYNKDSIVTSVCLHAIRDSASPKPKMNWTRKIFGRGKLDSISSNAFRYLSFIEYRSDQNTTVPYSIVLHPCRPANSHGFAVSLTIFCHFSRSHDKAPNLTVFWEKSFSKEVN